MNIKIFLTKMLIIFLFLNTNVFSKQTEDFQKGIKLFKEKKFDKSKIFFERDIVFNPKSEKSYLYLAKIFNKKRNDEEEEMNLNNVLLINPNNDEALYMLTLLKIKQSDYSCATKLINKFVLVCESFCYKKREIQEKLKTMNPENAENNN